MGLMDKAKEARAAQVAGMEASAEAAKQAVGSCPQPGQHYMTEVNKGSINMMVWQQHLNDMYRRGYRLQQVFEQDKNTVQVYEHHFH